MKKIITKTFIKVLVMFLLSASGVFADYDISWSTIDGGGGRSTGADFALVGTIGQPDAGEMAGGDYQLSGGFWPGRSTLALCIVNFEYFAELWLYWLDSSCDQNNWCEGADLDYSLEVDIYDVGELAYWWLAECPVDWPWE